MLGTRSDEWVSFHGARERFLLRSLAYFGVFLFIAFTAFVSLVYGVKFDSDQKTGWLLSIASGVFAGTAGTGWWQTDVFLGVSMGVSIWRRRVCCCTEVPERVWSML